MYNLVLRWIISCLIWNTYLCISVNNEYTDYNIQWSNNIATRLVFGRFSYQYIQGENIKRRKNFRMRFLVVTELNILWFCAQLVVGSVISSKRNFLRAICGCECVRYITSQWKFASDYARYARITWKFHLHYAHNFKWFIENAFFSEFVFFFHIISV